MSFDFSTLITDRSQADLDTLRALLSVPLADWTAGQLAEFNQAISKGSYNYTDLNRVTACMDYLNEVLTGLGYETGYQRIVVPHQGEPSPVGPLPYGYTELEYIESTGTQWIDTEFKPDQYTRVSLEFRATSNPSNDWILGVRKSTNVDSYGAMAGSATSITSWFGTASVTKTVSPITNRFNFDKNKAETTISYDDGESVIISNSPSEFKSEYNLFLLNINLANSPANAAISGRLYSCKIYSDGQLVRDFIPCINPDGEIGIYDAANGQFYENSGTGVFIGGPEIVTPDPEPPADPYTWYESDVPTSSLLSAYLANVSNMRSTLYLPNGTTEAPEDMMNLTLTEANNIESILIVIQNWILNMEQAWFFSNDLYSGEI